ncbi:hypothetical protein Pla22_23180 [Rubripirellula amarantea]|uniref:Glycosyl transferases group 1 n=1 Tax=Rubripirellula amarantea TaxID=2527999 RepID=A0A5C5WVS7_9BACT|nr:glycosyltransferase [Rubripirellula amarantea]TWT54668.1 hypothetical protein Pla22_23180 [Rubripirellula amarantea]
MLMSGVYVVSTEPPVFCVANNYLEVAAANASEAGMKAHFLVFPMWYAGDARGAISAFKATWKSRPHKVYWLCNAPAEERALRLLGLNASFCHHNLFCDETLFRPRAEKQVYDALYTAGLHNYKRVWLASKVPRLRIITASVQALDRLDDWGCSHAEANPEYLSKDDVAREICRSACCLALSKKEGGMFATTEYLLCGKPIVSTKSTGGRDFWFDPDNHVIAEADSSSVLNAVSSISKRTWQAEKIREHTLTKLRQQREILQDKISQISRRSLLSDATGNELSKRFVFGPHLPNLFSFLVGKTSPCAEVKAAIGAL